MEVKEVIPNVSEVIIHINKVISWMERQSESNNVHLLHLAFIKQYTEKKCCALSRQTTITDFFKTNN